VWLSAEPINNHAPCLYTHCGNPNREFCHKAGKPQSHTLIRSIVSTFAAKPCCQLNSPPNDRFQFSTGSHASTFDRIKKRHLHALQERDIISIKFEDSSTSVLDLGMRSGQTGRWTNWRKNRTTALHIHPDGRPYINLTYETLVHLVLIAKWCCAILVVRVVNRKKSNFLSLSTKTRYRSITVLTTS